MRKIFILLAVLISCTASTQIKTKVIKWGKVLCIGYCYPKPNPLDRNTFYLYGRVIKKDNEPGFDIYQFEVDNIGVLKPDAENTKQLQVPVFRNGCKNELFNLYPTIFHSLSKEKIFSCNYGDIAGMPLLKIKPRFFNTSSN